MSLNSHRKCFFYAEKSYYKLHFTGGETNTANRGSFVERYHSHNCCTKRSVINSRWHHYNDMIIAYPIRNPFLVNASRSSKFGKAFFEDLETQYVF